MCAKHRSLVTSCMFPFCCNQRYGIETKKNADSLKNLLTNDTRSLDDLSSTLSLFNYYVFLHLYSIKISRYNVTTHKTLKNCT